MKIISEISLAAIKAEPIQKLEIGSANYDRRPSLSKIEMALKLIGEGLINHSSQLEQGSYCHIFTLPNLIEGMLLTKVDPQAQTTKYQYAGKCLSIKISIQQRINKTDWSNWKNYIRQRNFVIRKGRKLTDALNDEGVPIAKPVSTPVIIVNNSRKPLSLSLEVGFWLVKKKYLQYGDLISLFSRYVSEEQPQYKKAVGTDMFLALLKTIVDNWTLAKNSEGFDSHIGIHLQNILRSNKAIVWATENYSNKTRDKSSAKRIRPGDDLTADENDENNDVSNDIDGGEGSPDSGNRGNSNKFLTDGLGEAESDKKLEKTLYYLRSRGLISKIRKKQGLLIFTHKDRERAKKFQQEKLSRKILADKYAAFKGIPKKSASRWIQRQTSRGIKLRGLYRLIESKLSNE